MAPKQSNIPFRKWRIAAQCVLILLSFLPLWMAGTPSGSQDIPDNAVVYASQQDSTPTIPVP
ncbi:MAG: hypothetical protein KDC66_01010 [Phaeodactylibacter sp.]|nr:hypothetical protein [Phaeodactylibacter sp.]MCB9276869.1 hypothetical protein [Lewinellaceae bacterium]